jgi:hypothetical protein
VTSGPQALTDPQDMHQYLIIRDFINLFPAGCLVRRNSTDHHRIYGRCLLRDAWGAT